MRRADAGFAATEFILGVAVLILPMVILVALVPRWSEAHLAAETAADAGAQAAVLAMALTDSDVEAYHEGREAGQAVLATYGVDGIIRIDATREQVAVEVTVALPAFPLLPAPERGPSPDRRSTSRGGQGEQETIEGLRTTARVVRLVDPFRAPVVSQ